MYARHYYRRELPPNYSGIAFSGVETASRPKASQPRPYQMTEEPKGRFPKMPPLPKHPPKSAPSQGKCVFGRELCALVGETSPSTWACMTDADAAPRDKTPKSPSSGFEDVFLIGILLFLLSEGFEEEGLLVLLTVLILLS
ncbi:MAG: hypothetical protein IJW46_05020 [Clostridia bacterium]|nr:hypothetical protein [Clostridia bacterium]